MAGIDNLTPWPKGVSGNPAGAKRGTKHISTWIQELLNDEEFEARILDSKIGLKEYKGAPLKAIIEVAIVKALNGDKQWADWIANNGWKQQIDVTSGGEQLQPLLVRFVDGKDDRNTD